MRVLMIAYEIDQHSPTVSWQERIAFELAEKCETVAVLAERVGTYQSRNNLYVEEFKRRPLGIPARLGGRIFLNLQAFKLSNKIKADVCLIHMAHLYSYRLLPAFQYLNLPTLLWYAHGATPFSLHLALRCVTRVITSSPLAFRIPSPKVHVIGQSIDTAQFELVHSSITPKTILSISRISKVKNIHKLIEMMLCLREISPTGAFRLKIVGAPYTIADEAYLEVLKQLVISKNLTSVIEFVGFLPNSAHPLLYKNAFVHVNVSQTGSMDKTVLEALSCGCPVVTSNPAYAELLRGSANFYIDDPTPNQLAARVLSIYNDYSAIDKSGIRALVVGNHDRKGYIDRLIAHLHAIKKE